MTIEEQIRVIQAASAKACQSPEAARKFLDDAGITELINEETMTHIHENNGKTFLMVEVPTTAVKTYILDSANGKEQGLFFKDMYETSPPWFVLPPGNWQIIGKANEVTEEQWKDIQDKEEVICNDFTSYTEAGLSILSSLSLSPQTTLILKKI